MSISNKERCQRYYQEHKQQSKLQYKQWIAEHPDFWKQYRWQLKQDVLGHYSLLSLGYTCCGCCQESNLSKLEIDHIQSNGSAHRKALFGNKNRSGAMFYAWLRRNGYPEGYQTLCGMCNNKKVIWDGELQGQG